MMKRMLSHESKTLTGAAIVLSLAALLSRVVGILRDRILAHQFGAGTELDIYAAAFRIPDFLYNILIVGALSAGFIPIFLELYKDKKSKAWEMTNTLFFVLAAFLIVLSLFIILLLPWLIQIFVPGFSPEAQQQTITLTRIMLLSPLILGTSAIVSSVLQSLKHFAVYSLTPILYNFGIIFGILFLTPRLGLKGLAWGVVIGAILHLAIQLPVLFHSGYELRLSWNLRLPALKKLFHLMVPRTLTLGMNHMGIFGLTFFLSALPAGSLAIFTFANNIAYVPIGMIGISFALAAFPALSELAIEKKWEKLAKTIKELVGQILFFIIPITVLFILLRAQIVRVLLGSGKFDWTDTILTVETLTVLCFGLFAQSLIPLLSRVFYAYEETKKPLFAAILGVVSTLLGAFFFSERFGVSGVALSVSLGALVQFLVLWYYLHRQVPHLNEKTLLKPLFFMSIAAIMMGVCVQGTKYFLSEVVHMERFWGILSQAIIAGILGILVYLSLCSLFRVPESKKLFAALQKKWLKLSGSTLEEIPETKIQ